MRGNTSGAVRAESVARLLVLAGVGIMAGAASFTHMHDWTMANVPAGTGDWFGWANAVASELTPTVAVLDIRKRRRAGRSGRALLFPGLVLGGAVALSLAAQFARAKPSVSGWLLAAVPAVAFVVLTKLVLSGGGHGESEPLRRNESSPAGLFAEGNDGQADADVLASVAAPVPAVAAAPPAPRPVTRPPGPAASIIVPTRREVVTPR